MNCKLKSSRLVERIKVFKRTPPNVKSLSFKTIFLAAWNMENYEGADKGS